MTHQSEDEFGPMSDIDCERVRIIRYFFVLPEAVSLPDGFTHSSPVGNSPHADFAEDDPEVTVVFHQVDASHGRTSAALEALLLATDRAEGLPEKEDGSDPIASVQSAGLTAEFTVVEAFTSTGSPDTVPVEDQNYPARWLPRADPFSRCLRLVNDIMRAYRQATETPYGLPTYERALSPVLSFTAEGVRESTDVDGQRLVLIRATEPWDGGGLMLLDHSNLPDTFRGAEFDAQIAERFTYWMRELQRGNPLHLWRERFIEARRARHVHGDTAQTITLANTSCELLLDVTLALLMWEQGIPVAQAAALFEEGKVLRRLTAELTPRLKGNWSTDQGAVGAWYTDLYKKRHRVVHGGYTPSPAEADRAIEAAAGLQRFVMDRIVTQRTFFPRSTLMTVAEAGLRARNMWNGQIKRFAEEVAPNEPNWRDSFTAFHQQLIAATAP